MRQISVSIENGMQSNGIVVPGQLSARLNGMKPLSLLIKFHLTFFFNEEASIFYDLCGVLVIHYTYLEQTILHCRRTLENNLRAHKHASMLLLFIIVNNDTNYRICQRYKQCIHRTGWSIYPCYA